MCAVTRARQISSILAHEKLLPGTMARGRQSQQGGGGGGALLACNRAIDKSDEYKKSVKMLQARVQQIADTVRPDGDLAEILRAAAATGSGNDDSDEAFLSKSYDRLKALGVGNAKRMEDIDNFVDAIKEVKTQVERNSKNGNNDAAAAAEGGNVAAEGGGEGAGTTTTPAVDYERAIHDALENIRRVHEQDTRRIPPEEHELSIDIRKALGEKIKKNKNTTRGGGDVDDDDDDELEIVNNRSDDVHALKCPITAMLFDNPVRNKVCGHVYDLAGLKHLLASRKTKCPVSGCANTTLSLTQIEDDEQMKLKVKRHKQREVNEKRNRDLEDDENDDQVLE